MTTPHDSIRIVVRGTPGPQGSKKAVGTDGKGRAILVESSAKVKPWREDVKAAAVLARMRVADGHDIAMAMCNMLPPLDGPLVVSMVFTLRKPASAPKRRRTWPDRTPDLSKLCRATEDALTDAGVWADDARVVEYARLAKVFPGEDRQALDTPGCVITVCRLYDPDSLEHLNDANREIMDASAAGVLTR